MKIRSGEISLRVSDLERSMKFYGDAFGLERHPRMEHSDGSWAKLRNEQLTLCLFRSQNAGTGKRALRDIGRTPEMTMDIMVDDLDELVRRLQAAGATVAPIRQDREWRASLFTDLDGIAWEIIEDRGNT